MPRVILDIEGLAQRLPLTVHQLYKAIRHRENPLPYKKFGKRLLFDWEAVSRWFDALPGKDFTRGGFGE